MNFAPRPPAMSAYCRGRNGRTLVGQAARLFNGGSMHNKDIEERSPPVSYSQPRLVRLGTFRELTRSGGAAFSDMFATDSGAGCVMNGSSSYTCRKL